MAIEMLYFAWVRERIGRGAETVTPPPGAVSVADLIDWLAANDSAHAAAFADRSRLRTAVDQRFVPLEAPIGNAHEVAIFPPVTGG